MHSITFFFLCEQTFLTGMISHKAIVNVSYETTLFFFNVEPLVSIYIARKIH